MQPTAVLLECFLEADEAFDDVTVGSLEMFEEGNRMLLLSFMRPQPIKTREEARARIAQNTSEA